MPAEEITFTSEEKIMATRARLVCLSAVGVLLVSSTGCIVIGMGGWPFGGSSVWTESTTGQIPIDTADLKALEVRTHNGSITFDAQPAGTTEAYVTVTKKAGGRTHADAEAAFESLEVYVKPAGSGTQRIGWKWKGIKRSNWGAHVSFEIKAPGDLRFDGETHNGSVDIEGIIGEVRLVTHNGPVTVESANGKLYAETHNGKVVAAYTGDEVTLLTHNGSISADLAQCAAVNGSITTHNGSVEVVVGENASANLECRTHNGAIKCDAPLDDFELSRRTLTGTIGSGEGNLDVTTHNGSVRIKKTTG